MVTKREKEQERPEELEAQAAAAAAVESAKEETAEPEVAGPKGVTLEGLRAGGYVLAEAVRPEGRVVVTKGGRKLVFPRDVGALLTPEELDGIPRKAPVNRIFGKKAGK